MKHRHIYNSEGLDYSIAKISSIIERGRSHDIWELFNVLRNNPLGTAADNALVAANNSDVYGYPKLIKLCLEDWRNGNKK